MKPLVAYVDIRFSAHATENLEKVKRAAYNLFPSEKVEEVAFQQNKTKGHYGNPITVFKIRIKDKALIEAFIKELTACLSALDKETILREFNLFLEKSNLYLRLDKQAAFEDEIKLGKVDPIHIRIHFTRREEKNIQEICRELGLLP